MSNFVEILFAFDWAGAITILNANPELASQRTKNNDLPIHLVLDLGGSSPDPLQWDLIKLLIKHYPESVHKANHVGMLPIHSVARLDEDVFHTLMDQYPAGVMAKDNEGNLPLHYAIFCYAALNRIDGLVAVYPAGVKEHNKLGKTPIDLAFEQRKDGKGFRPLNLLLDASWENSGGALSSA